MTPIRANPNWSTLLDYNIPLSVGDNPTPAPTVMAAITEVDPELLCAQPPRCLTTHDSRVSNTQSTIVQTPIPLHHSPPRDLTHPPIQHGFPTECLPLGQACLHRHHHCTSNEEVRRILPPLSASFCPSSHTITSPNRDPSTGTATEKFKNILKGQTNPPSPSQIRDTSAGLLQHQTTQQPRPWRPPQRLVISNSPDRTTNLHDQ